MVLINDRPTAGTSGVTGSATGVAGTGAGSTGATGATATGNDVADSGAALLADTTGTANTGTSTVVASTSAGRTGAAGATGRSTATSDMVITTVNGIALATGTAIQADKIDETQERISLPPTKANLAKELHNNQTNEHHLLTAQIHTFLLQESPNLTQLNDAENNPVVGTLNIPKSIMIRVLHYFGAGTNPIGVSSLISVKILSLVGNGSSTKPTQSMVFPR